MVPPAARLSPIEEAPARAATAPSQARVATGCGQWRLCDSTAVSLEEVAAVIDGVLGLEQVPGRTAPNAPMLDAVRALTYHGVLSTCTDRPAALLGHRVGPRGARIADGRGRT